MRNVETSDQKTEAHQLRVRMNKQSGDISRKPLTIVRSDLQDMNEGSLLLHADVKWENCSLLLHSLNVIRRVRRQEVTLLNAYGTSLAQLYSWKL